VEPVLKVSPGQEGAADRRPETFGSHDEDQESDPTGPIS
jgi:hypothetical protein